jgi:hypothetical protein
MFGGETAKPLEFEWIGSQEHRNKNGSSDSKCGASLIIDGWALTAAHFMGFVMKIVFGKHNLAKLENTESEFSIIKVTIFHNKYTFEYKAVFLKIFFLFIRK